MSGDGQANAERIVGALLRAGVEIAASLPDSWLSPLIERISNEPKIMHIRVTREDDGAGVCAGASLGGKRAVLVCQNAGLLLSANALAGCRLYVASGDDIGVNQGMIMVLAVVVIGGLVGSGALGYDVAQGLQQSLFGQGVLASLAIPFHVVDRIEDVAIVEDAVREASLARRPVVVLLRRAALLGDAKAS